MELTDLFYENNCYSCIKEGYYNCYLQLDNTKNQCINYESVEKEVK